MGLLRITTLLAGLSLATGGAAWSADLVDAARRDDRGAVLAELEGGADATLRAPDGTTALHWAVYHDDVELVTRLLEAGAELNVANEYGATPLGEAAVAANTTVIEALLESGADPTTRWM